MKNSVQTYKTVVLIATMLIFFSSYSFACKIPKGIFLLLSASNYPSESLLKKDFITGISIRVRWRDIERSPGNYDWKYLDEIFNIAKKTHKKVFLRLLGGFWAPSWIYNKGVPWLSIKVHGKGFAVKGFVKKYGENIKLPIVWDKKYLKLWGSFVKAVGKRYNSDPQLVLVHLSGPTFFSAEVILARNLQELKKLKDYGFNEEVILKAWKETIKIFKTSFPQISLALNIHYVVKNPCLGIYLRLVKSSCKLLKGCLVIQGNWLTPRHVQWLRWLEKSFDKEFHIPDKKMLDLFIKLRKQRIPIGFQEAYPFSKVGERRNISIDKLKKVKKRLFWLFCKLKVNYIEVYPEDIENIFWIDLWKSFSKRI